MSNQNDEDVNYETESDDGIYEDPAEIIKEFGSHRLMEPAQRALVAQLKDKQTQIKEDLFIKEEDLKRVTKEREILGVQLYNLQQQLAKLQISLEEAHNEYNTIVDAKLQEEEIVKSLTGNNAEQKALLDEHQKQAKKYAAELEALNETLRQIETYNQEVKSEIAMTKRAAHKAEQSMQNLEKHKETQDIYVDRLNKRLKDLQEQIGIHSGQLEAQRKETLEANGVLQDTVRELELIGHEKKQLMTQWKAALAGLSRRDEALAQASQTLLNAERAVHDYDVEIEALRRNIQKEQARNENLVSVRDRLENELQWVEESLAKIRAERDQLQERFALLNKSLAQTDGEAKKLDATAKTLGTDSESLLQNLQVVIRERQRLEEEMQIARSTESNVSKAVQNLQKQQAKILKQIHERENEAVEVENETARTKVDKLNAGMVNDLLRDQLAVASKDFTAQEALIEKYQVEIRQRNDEIEKKMYRVDRLNKKYDKMVEGAGGEENLGPLENTVKNLQKEIDSIGEECKELEREWLKRQTEMVGITAESENIAEINHELQARVTILTQQQLRLTKDLRSLKSEVKVANHSNIDLQKDVAKLNILISQNQDQEGHLQNDNYVLEMECVEELKTLERECVTLQSSINETKTAKANILDQIMDTERQALLWEKKIQLDKETQEALDPTVGQQETANMEREIHRMQLRLEALKREQERLSIEMERAIHKRAAVATRFSNRSSTAPAATTGSKSTKSKADMTQAAAKKKIAALKKESRSLADEVARYGAGIEERKALFSEVTSDLERLSTKYADLEESNAQLQNDINNLLYQKQLNQERISYRQKYVKRLREYSNAGVEASQSLQVERRLLASSQAVDNVKEIISELQAHNPHLSDVLRRVFDMTDCGIAFEVSD